MAIHVQCFARIPSEEAGMAHVCPGCYKTAGAADDPDDASKQTAVLRSGFAKGVISAPIDFDKGVDDQRPACDLLEPLLTPKLAKKDSKTRLIGWRSPWEEVSRRSRCSERV